MRHRRRDRFCWGVALLAGPALLFCGGCVVSVVGGMASDTLSAAILNQDDPSIVSSGLPAYLLVVDGFIIQSPDNAGLLSAGAQLFALYGSRFAEDAAHGLVLTAKSRRYGARAICLEHEPACNWSGLKYDRFVAELAEVDRRQTDVLYAYAVSWLSHLDAASSDWAAVGELPWVQAAMNRVMELDESHDDGGVHVYLGILNALRPPALGGQLDVAKAHFERAIELSNGTDLSAKVEYARRYGRMMFDQELHDRLLDEVIAAPAEAPGRTLLNVLAKRDAAELLASSADYF
ncbi:MAG: TRAP transporter TatT component family protein [Gammaproteobacteria bacterium]